jgi:hypothetical protein
MVCPLRTTCLILFYVTDPIMIDSKIAAGACRGVAYEIER